jgi:hypothetical protein
MTSVIAGAGVHRKRLSELLATTVGTVRIASAYVTEAKLFAERGNRDVRLLTALSAMDLVAGATSLDALETLIQNGIGCRVLPQVPKFHAKLYIFGGETAIVTSANFTVRALNSNIEVGAQITGGEVEELAHWFDHLWNSAELLDGERISSFRRLTTALRREFAFLRARCDLADLPGTLLDIADDARSPRFVGPRSYFLCNTNRTHGGYERETLMRRKQYATAWENFSHTSHMQTSKMGDIIFMYANHVGIIGIGKALGACEVLERGDAGRVSDEESGREWRIPVEWLRWVDEAHACPWDRAPPTTFTNVSGDPWADRRDQAIRRLLGNSAIIRDLGL